MNWKLVGLWVVLADFAALTAYAVWQFGIVGLFDAAFANVATVTLFTDLVISLSLVSLWMIGDARQRGTTALPYVVTTLLLGSIGPLLYLIRRERSAAASAAFPTTGRRVPA
jgi:Terpene cyclase DEP1